MRETLSSFSSVYSRRGGTVWMDERGFLVVGSMARSSLFFFRSWAVFSKSVSAQPVQSVRPSCQPTAPPDRTELGTPVSQL